MPKKRVAHRKKSAHSSSRSEHQHPLYRRRILLWFLLFLSVVFLFVIGYQAVTNQDVPVPTVDTQVGTFTGTTPCADCSGIMTTLTLNKLPNTYILRMVYVGKNTSATESGTWSMSEKGNPEKTIYTLTSTAGANSYYEQLNPNQVRQLDANGNELPANLPFTLTRQ